MRKQGNALGDVCPVPVVKTTNAIKELGTAGGSVETLVDNEIAVQNLTKMARQKGYPVKAEKMEEQRYRVVMEIAGDGAEAGEEEPVGCKPDSRKNNEIVVISSEYMGEGDPRLGRALMKSYLYALTCQEELPDAVIFYNGGVKLTCGEGEVLEDLRSLEAQGVELLSCGTCLNFYGLTEKLKVGSVTNMYVIAEKMGKATLLVKP